MKLLKSILIPLILGISLVLGSCAFLQTQAKEVVLEPVLLTEITFKGESAGIVGPGEFGDFSITHYLYNAPYKNFLTVLEFLPMDETLDTAFMLWVKSECPEAVALEVYNRGTKESEYFIYDSSGVPHKATKEAFDVATAAEYECPPAMQEM